MNERLGKLIGSSTIESTSAVVPNGSLYGLWCLILTSAQPLKHEDGEGKCREQPILIFLIIVQDMFSSASKVLRGGKKPYLFCV